MDNIEEKFLQMLMFMGIPINEIRNEDSFTEDYDFDGSQFICLVLYLGIFFQIDVNESEYSEIDTVGGAFNLIKKKLEIR